MNGEQPQSQQNQGDAHWQFRPEEGAQSTPPTSTQPTQWQEPSPAPYTPPVEQEVSWTASEFIAHQKSALWYLGLAGATVVIGGLVYLIGRDRLSTGLVVFMAVLIGIAANRKPRILNYSIGSRGITIGQKSYPFSDFKSFSVVNEGAFNSIMLLPMKRFMPTVSIYYDPRDEDRIVDVLAGHLPMETRGHDPLDRLIRSIRF